MLFFFCQVDEMGIVMVGHGWFTLHESLLSNSSPTVSHIMLIHIFYYYPSYFLWGKTWECHCILA